MKNIRERERENFQLWGTYISNQHRNCKRMIIIDNGGEKRRRRSSAKEYIKIHLKRLYICIYNIYI